VDKLLEKAAVEPQTIYMRRWQDGGPIGRTKLVPEFRENFGAPYWVVHRAHLQQALVYRAADLGARVVVDSRVAQIDFDEGTVTTVSRSWEGSCKTLALHLVTTLFAHSTDKGFTILG
jgi:salicylate hydroxylase